MKGSSRHSPESSAGWARFSNYFPTPCLPCFFSIFQSFRFQRICCFLMFAILEEPLKKRRKNRCLGESPSPKRIFGGAAKFAGFSLASPTMLGVTARSAVNHCGVPNTSLLSNELQLEYARSQIIHSSQFTKFNSAYG